MSYSADSFVADEVPTTAKWNKLWTNDASFNDGSGIGDDAIIARHIADGQISAAMQASRTRSINMLFFAEGAGGASSAVAAGMPQVAFTGTPSGFMRTASHIPADYAGGDVTIRLKTYATNTATHTARRYVNADAAGDSTSSFWDIDNNVQTTGLSYTANTLRDIDITVAAANLAVDSLLSIAWRIETAITGTVYVDNVSLRYTAQP